MRPICWRMHLYVLMSFHVGNKVEDYQTYVSRSISILFFVNRAMNRQCRGDDDLVF